MSAVRSASGVGATVLCAGFALVGCATTQQAAVRVQLNSARIRASERPTTVRVRGRALNVMHVALIEGRGGSAIVVRLHNPGSRSVSDLPISVGFRKGAARGRPLNRRSSAEFSYFESHVPVVGAGTTVDWVYATRRHAPAGARPYAIVGGRASVRAPRLGAPPVIGASLQRGGVGARATVALQNRSSIPQYQLQVYAVARRGRRYLAAGALTVAHLGSGGHRTVEVPIVGDPGRIRPKLEAIPTITS